MSFGQTNYPWFKDMREGDSAHFLFSHEARSVASAFKYWANTRSVGLVAVTRTVLDEDPDGRGCRVWFLKERPHRRSAPEIVRNFICRDWTIHER